MLNICIFAGTTEGRKLIQYYKNKNICITACVATEYGEDVILNHQKTENIDCSKENNICELSIHTGKMDSFEMSEFFKNNSFDVVVDATHPYAKMVTQNIKIACKEVNIEYIRLNRNESEQVCGRYFASIEDSISYLSEIPGNILLTTGSNELNKFTMIPKYKSRIYPRVLPLSTSLDACKKYDFDQSHIIAMQGPFSKQLNKALMKSYDIKFLVTKESGNAGGFMDKINAAKECGVESIIIGRPANKDGLTYDEVISHIDKMIANAGVKLNNKSSSNNEVPLNYKLNDICYSKSHALHQNDCFSNLHNADNINDTINIDNINYCCDSSNISINIIGIGTGSINQMTMEAVETIKSSDVLIGAKRVIQGCKNFDKPTYCAFSPEEILAYIDNHPEYKKVSILMSGDIGFYSGAKKLLHDIAKDHSNHKFDIKVICGISSPIYLCSKLGISWDDIKLCSIHGRYTNIINIVKRNFRTFALLGGEYNVLELCRLLTKYNLGYVKIYVGENLSYDNEKVTIKRAEELYDGHFDVLSSVIIENDRFNSIIPTCIPDESFIRREKIPMTKSEIRCISVAKLRLNSDSIVYDIGAGSGSVSIEMALQAYNGVVYAIEKKHEAIELINENKLHFAVSNIEVIEGEASSVISDMLIDGVKSLPRPTHAFIGGSSGNLDGIMTFLIHRNNKIKIVINAITIETLSETLECIKKHDIKNYEVINLMVSKSKKIGNYNMMLGQNPIYIITIN